MTRAVARSSVCRLAHSRAGWLAGWLANLRALLAVISSLCVLLCFLLLFGHWLIIVNLSFTAGLLITVAKFSRVNDLQYVCDTCNMI